MFPNQLDSPMKKPQDSLLTQPLEQIVKQNLIQYLIFYLLLLLIDTALLIQYFAYFQFIVPKIGINVSFIILAVVLQKKLTYKRVNFILLITKVISIFFILLIGRDYTLIIAFVVEQHNIHQEKRICFIQRIFIKIGCLVLMIIQFNKIEITIVACILMLEAYKFQLIIKEYKLKQPEYQFTLQQNKSQRETFTACTKDQTWINKISTLPLCYIMISRKDLRIQYKNQNVYQHFSQTCKTEEDFDELILKRMKYSIIQEQNEDQNNIATEQHIKKNRLKNYLTQNHQQENSQESIKRIQLDRSSLIEILETYNEGKLQDAINPINNSIELFCQFFWAESKLSTYSGQILINHDDEEIILTLIDISKQNRFQEERIKDQFKTSIVQSFSHELRTPLNSSCNFLQFCLNEKSITEDIKNNFITPALNALRLQSYLINDIIDFSSLCSDNMELDLTNVTVEQIVDEVSKLFKSVLEMKNLILYVDLTENQLKCIGTDFSRLIQIIANILQNSIKFSNQGMILLKLTSFSQDYLKITIKDEGFGIEEERLQQIHKMLLDVEERKNFSDYQTWHGFGLLISSMLLSKLRPHDYKSLLIRSGGHQKGTKVTFYIQNHKLTHQSSSIRIKENPRRFNSKLRASQSGSNHVSFNGTLIQISDLFVSNRRVKINTQFINRHTLKSVKSGENNSAFSVDSFINMDQDYQIGELQHLQPFVFTDHAYQPSKFSKLEQSPRSNKQQTKIVSYKQLKLQEDQESEQLLKQVLKKRKCTCKRLLSVDDEIFNQKSIQFLLSQYGFEVVLAFNGEEALKVVKETTKCSPSCCLYLLILMDYQMPIMNGLKATVALRQLMDLHQIPTINVIGLTAFNSKNDIELCFSSGMSAVLTKPLIVAEFFEILKCM